MDISTIIEGRDVVIRSEKVLMEGTAWRRGGQRRKRPSKGEGEKVEGRVRRGNTRGGGRMFSSVIPSQRSQNSSLNLQIVMWLMFGCLVKAEMEKSFVISLCKMLNLTDQHGFWNENKKSTRCLSDICRGHWDATGHSRFWNWEFLTNSKG